MTETNTVHNTKIRPVSEADLALLLEWRNHIDVRRFMYTQHEISLDEHQAWFEKSLQDSAKHLLIFEHDHTPQGFVNISSRCQGKIADWGFYMAPDAPKGLGRLMGEDTLRYVFEDCDIYKLCGQCLSYNQKSINFHLSLGFTKEAELVDHHYDGEQFHDVWYFRMLQADWNNSSSKRS